MRKKKGFSDETGAALIAVIFISILLVTACAFLLSAVGYNSRNSTDVLLLISCHMFCLLERLCA